MTLKDLEYLIIMYEAYQKHGRVFLLLYGDMNNEDMGYAVGFDDGIFGAFSRLEDILYRNSRLDTDSTDIILDDKKLSPAEKAKLIIKS